MKTIVIGGGCFWCIEALFSQIKGVKKALSGYAGGTLRNPTYHQLGDHAEVVQITYDETILPLETLFDIFLKVHNPTTVDRQGNDIGSQYRSVILCNNNLEIEQARRVIKGNQELWDSPIVTTVGLLDTFYPAEDYHQDYFNKNPKAGYCQVVINPKLQHFKKAFDEFLK